MFQTFKPTERELFNRDGTPNKRVFAIGAKGKPWTSYVDRCGRCGGAGGADKWKHTGWTCFDCGGSGKGPVRSIPLYTAEELATLNARKAKADATRQRKRDAELARQQAAADARRADFMATYGDLLKRMEQHASANEFIADVLYRALTYCDISQGQVDAVVASMDRTDERKRKAAASDYVGQIGERIEREVTVERVSSFKRPAFNAPWDTETVWVVRMRDADGNCLVSMGRFREDEGRSFTLRGTVKSHEVFNEQKQTKLSRAQVYVPKAKKGKVA